MELSGERSEAPATTGQAAPALALLPRILSAKMLELFNIGEILKPANSSLVYDEVVARENRYLEVAENRLNTVRPC